VIAKRPAIFNPYLLALALFMLIGMSFIYLSTHFGAFLSDDSYYYIQPARAALQGDGYNPSPYFAPLLSAVLVLLGWFKIEPLLAIRYLNIFLFGLNILLTWIIVKQAVVSDLFVGLATLLVLLADVLLEMHGWAMSEALYMTFVLAAILLLFLYLSRPTYLRLILAASAVALACLTRYAALPVVPALAITQLVYDKNRSFLSKVWRCCIYTAISLVPLSVYLIRNYLISGLPTGYVGYEAPPLNLARLTWYLYNTLSWFIPGRFIRGREVLIGILFSILLCVVIFVYLKLRPKTNNRINMIPAGIFSLVAFIILNFLMLFLAGGVRGLVADSPRYLAPLLWAILILIVYLLDRFWKTGRRWVHYAVAVFCLVFVVYYGVRTYDYLTYMYQTGLGYSNIGWHTSETVTYLKNHPDIKVVSTGEMGIYFWTGKRPPVITNFGGVDGLRQHLCQSGDYLLIMNQMPTEIYHMKQEEVIQGLTLVKIFNDSSMFQCLQPGVPIHTVFIVRVRSLAWRARLESVFPAS
jgi:hypothetical protein